MAIVSKAALMGIVQPLTGLSATSVVWAKDPYPMVSDVDAAIVTLSLRSFTQLGVDNHRYQFVPGNNPPTTATFETDEIGLRNVVLSLRCEVYNNSAEAGELLDRVRSLLHQQSTLTALNGINLALQYSELISDLPTKYDNRVVNCAVLDVHLGGQSIYSATQTGQGWIDTVDTADKIPGTLTP